MEELWQAGGASAGGPRFSVVWRGYDRRQVDEYVRQREIAAERSAGAGPGDRGLSSGDRELSPIDRRLAEFFSKEAPRQFDVVLRGYDRKEVDRYLEQLDG